MPRTILIVDDESANREILAHMLQKDYAVLSADGGEKALAILRENYSLVSAVLLDLKMPDMDGFEVLRLIREDDRCRSIPVIIVTALNDVKSEEKAVSLGAYGFVTKPYRSLLIKRHLINAISFRESASLQNIVSRDELTGILNMRGFTEQAETLIKSKPLGYYTLSCFDVDSFKIINDQYGTGKGDQVLKFVAKTISDSVTPLGGICCRIWADDFASMYPTQRLGCVELQESYRRVITPDCISRTVGIRIGRYLVDDISVPVSTMYDRAVLAKESIRGRYDTHEAFYNDGMRKRLLREQQIVSEMVHALADNQFETWFQPQFNHATGALVGAEALVRWRHPEKGLMPPYEFINVFERNGFIYSLDKYIWEQVCMRLRKWIDQGRNPLPVSVNISREDISRGDIIDTLTSLIRKYSLDISLLRLEITETAFAESSDMVADVVKRLIERGFTVEIDDFGSGYSSLNTLKDIPAQIIKLDMKFLESKGDSQRGGNIVESIVRMAKWLGMSVIAEGVETLRQADYLRSIGCCYMQGYLYAKPMTTAQYEKFCVGNSKEEHLLTLETVENLDNNAFWDPDSIDTLIFNSYVGAACIYEYCSGKIEVLRATEKYAQVIGSAGMTVEDALRLDWAEHLDVDSRARITRNIASSAAAKSEVTDEYVFLDLPGCPHITNLRSTLRVIACAGERYLVYCTNENVTAQRRAEREARETVKHMRTLMNDTPGGFARMRLHPDGTGRTEYVNDGFCKMLGMTRDEVLSTYSQDLMIGVHPDDFEMVSSRIADAMATDGLMNAKYRLMNKSGEYVWMQVFARFVKAENGDTIINCYYVDLSDMEKRELNLRETMPFILSAIMKSSENLDFAKDKNFNYICCSPAFVRFTRQKSEADVIGKNDYDFWTKEEADHFRSDDIRLFEGGESLINFTEPIPSDDGVQHYSVTSKYILRDSAGEIIGLYGSGHDITDTRAALDRLQLITDNIPGGIATYSVKDGSIRVAYCNDGFCRLFGGTREGFEERGDFDPMQWVLEEDRKELLNHIDALVNYDTPMDVLFRIRVLGGGIKWISEKAVATARQNDTVMFNAILLDITERQNAVERLRISEEENSLATRLGGNIIARFSIADRTLTLQSDAAKANSLPATIEGVPDEPIRLGFIAKESAKTYRAFFESILGGSQAAGAIFLQKYLGGWRWMEAKSSLIFGDGGEAVKAIISFNDVTEKIERETIYKKWQQSLSGKHPESYTLYRCNISKNSGFDTTEGSLLTIDFKEGSFDFNERTAEYVSKCVYEDDRDRFFAFLNVDALLADFYQGNRVLSIEYREKLADGVRWLKLTVDLVDSPYTSDVDAYMLFEDIDASKKLELQMKALSETDPLTGLLNRNTFAKKVNVILGAAKPENRYALIMLDVDGFKQVNDVFGHAAGDQTLTDIALGLRSIMRHDDLVARLGGDEFVVFLSGLLDRQSAATKAKQICALVRRSFSLEVRISASVGITVAPRDGRDFDTLYRKADAALYHVKGSGKDNYAFYNENMEGEHLVPEPDSVSPESGKKAEKKRRMLIVDDSVIDYELLQSIFCNEFIIEKAKDGNTALIRLRHYGSAISVVLLDLMMPGMDGYAVLEKIQQSVELRSIPVIIVSGDESRETCLAAIRKGATDFITKPVDADLLRIRVHSAVSKAENERLRAKNSLLEVLNEERIRYDSALDSTGITFVEFDWRTGEFTYYPSVSNYLLGTYDGRAFWQILLSDMVADTKTVRELQRLVHRVAEDKTHSVVTMRARLKTPKRVMHSFRVTVRRLTNEFQLTSKLIITLDDMDYDAQSERR